MVSEILRFQRFPITVHRNRLSAYGMENHQPDQFFWNLLWPVVVRTICGKRGESVGVVVGANHVVGSGLGRGVRAVGSVRSDLRERRIAGPERAITPHRSKRGESGKPPFRLPAIHSNKT